MRNLSHSNNDGFCTPLTVFAFAIFIASPYLLNAAPGAQESVTTAPKMDLAARVQPNSEGDRAALEMSIQEAMWTALAFEDAARVQDLLKRGAAPNKPEELTQMTPLMAAETAALTKILLEAGADPDQRDRVGRTALHHAMKAREAASIVRVLGQAGADLNARAADIGECTPLHVAVEYYMEVEDHKEIALAMRILVHLGADIDATDAAGRSVLAIAAKHNQPELIRLLIELGADPGRKLGDGRTPVDYARGANAVDALKALSAGAAATPRAN
jgi:ankyrin repeat protein